MIIILTIVCITISIAYILEKKQVRALKKKNQQFEKNIMKFKEYYELLDQWMMNKEQGLSVENYFVKNGYKNIAIYGMGPLGVHLYDELSKSRTVRVSYVIDKKGTSIFQELCVKKPTEELPHVDAVIITVTVAYKSIVFMLKDKIDTSLISLEEVICES